MNKYFCVITRRYLVENFSYLNKISLVHFFYVTLLGISALQGGLLVITDSLQRDRLGKVAKYSQILLFLSFPPSD